MLPKHISKLTDEQLNQQIAEKIFGFKKVGLEAKERDVYLKLHGAGMRIYREGKKEFVYVTRDDNGEESVVPHLPLWSTRDGIAVTEVFQWLRKTGDWCCLNMSSDYHYVWDVLLTSAHKPGDEDHKADIVVTSESLARAICIAALWGLEFDHTFGGKK